MRKILLFIFISFLSSYLVYTYTNKSQNYIEKKYEPVVEKKIIENNIEEEPIASNLSEIIEEIHESNNQKEKELMILKIPKIDFNGYIYEKNSKLNNIDKNVIIMKESDYPDLEGGIVIIGAHSGIGKYAYFKRLNEIDIGDLVTLKYNNIDYNYKVINYHLDSKDGSIIINNVNNKNKLILYTCNPGDKNNYLVVESELIN